MDTPGTKMSVFKALRLAVYVAAVAAFATFLLPLVLAWATLLFPLDFAHTVSKVTAVSLRTLMADVFYPALTLLSLFLASCAFAVLCKVESARFAVVAALAAIVFNHLVFKSPSPTSILEDVAIALGVVGGVYVVARSRGQQRFLTT